MRTFLAFKFKNDVSQDYVVNKANFLKDYYQTSYLNYELELQYVYLKNSGSLIIDDKNSPINFSSSLRNRNLETINYFPPLEVNSSQNSQDQQMHLLIDKLLENPKHISELSSPFLFSVLDIEKEEMTIFNDGFALNRLYKLETDQGVFWSNRPAALLIFSETMAEMDLDSWKIYATSGWFVNETSPFKNIKRVRPGVLYKVSISGEELYKTISTNSINNLVKLAHDESNNFEQIANEMSKEIESFTKLWKSPPEVDLSGGVDSRVAAANMISSDVSSYQFRSIKDIEAEVITAKKLLEISKINEEINIIDSLEYIMNQDPLIDRIKKILFEFDGDFATVMINSPIVENNTFQTIDKLQIFGFGGEIAKGAFYSNKRWIEKLKKMGETAPFYRLTTHFVKVGCTTEESIELMKKEFSKVLNLTKNYKIKGLNELDYFYFHERFRRWSPAGDRVSSYSPFYNKHFISFGLNNSPQKNIDYFVHKNLINQMQPDWDEIPFFKATPEQSKEKDSKNIRIWQTKDKIQIEEILRNSESWNDVFIENEVKALWEKAKSEGIPNFQETLFQRVALRSLFNQHIDKINHYMNK